MDLLFKGDSEIWKNVCVMTYECVFCIILNYSIIIICDGWCGVVIFVILASIIIVVLIYQSPVV